MPPSRVWLVTGASSGFGLEMSRCALEHGDRVVATLRDPSALADLASKYSSAQLLVAKVDVTNHDEIKTAFRRAKDAFGRVDIVFNNAGYVLTGEAETTPEELAKDLFEVDFWGAVRVSQEAVRFFREDNNPQGGYLIQNSAAAGIAAFPALGFYTAAKHALEGFTDTLYKELEPAWNIKITSVEAGGFKTEVFQSARVAPQHPAYAGDNTIASIIRKSLAGLSRGGERAYGLEQQDTKKGVEKLFALTLLPNPPLHIPLGLDSLKWVREYIEELTRDVECYAHWSEGLACESA